MKYEKKRQNEKTIITISVTVVLLVVVLSIGFILGDPYDNAVAENFFNLLKCDCPTKRKDKNYCDSFRFLKLFSRMAHRNNLIFL